MDRHAGFQRLLLGATAAALVILVAPSAGATNRQSDGWLHGAEAPAAPEITDGWMVSGAPYRAAPEGTSQTGSAVDGWATSLATIQRIASAPDRPAMSLASVREANVTGTSSPGKPTTVAGTVTDGWMHSNVVKDYRPPVFIGSRGTSTGISIELAAGMSAIALLAGVVFAARLTSRRYRHARPA